MECKYIYGIIEASEEKLFDLCGSAAYEKVHTIPYQDISAVASDSSFVEYTTLPKDQVARYLLTHQQVIEKIMDSHAIIPMRLGTYAFNKGEVKEILCKGRRKFKDILKKIENKIELDVAATWNDLNSTIKEVGEVQEIRELKEKLMSRPGGVSVEDQIKIGSLLKSVLNKKREKISSEIRVALERVSIDLKAHDLMDDRMIFNAAFFIDKVRKNEFEKELDALNESYGGKIDFRCVGPLPPYSFYTAEVKKIPFSDIEWAKEKLGLNNMATKEDIIKAYRSKAGIYHPDKNINSSDAERQFNEIFRAYKILLEYCDGNACLPGEKEFSQNAIVVKVRE
ncbi:MAG: GvpL/GvpF family gas vesicle protein [Thermodesulfovibrionales bacterium]|nr:GvpL/GvpF family gas vesicle protein [Thermodesulfovibrionales bacterium]